MKDAEEEPSGFAEGARAPIRISVEISYETSIESLINGSQSLRLPATVRNCAQTGLWRDLFIASAEGAIPAAATSAGVNLSGKRTEVAESTYSSSN